MSDVVRSFEMIHQCFERATIENNKGTSYLLPVNLSSYKKLVTHPQEIRHCYSGL